MASTKLLDHVISHWHHSVPNFSTSAQDFYALVEEGVKCRQLPEDVAVSRVDFAEAGTFSAKREYLRVARHGVFFDICAAPFGGGFFMSSWLVKPPPAAALVAFATALTPVAWSLLFWLGLKILGATESGMFGGGPSLIQILFALVASIVGFFLVMHLLVHADILDGDLAVAIPAVGWVYEKVFAPPTYYKLDTAQMFADAVHGAVLEAFEQVTQGKGVRALTELERKPVMSVLLR